MTDEELMAAVCRGEQSAYQTLVKQHLKAISHYAFRLLGNKKDTEDIAQETFLKLWINASNWDVTKAKLTTWLHRITHNLCIDHLRKHGRVQVEDFSQQEIETEEGGKQNYASPTGRAFPVGRDKLEDEEKLERVKTAISHLPETQRSALTLCYYQGFSNKEAAVIMHISVKALESAIARAKRSLRSQLSGT